MDIALQEDGRWYHGSHERFDILREGSTVTPWRELAEAFSHKPDTLAYEDDSTIRHKGKETGYLYVIEEPVAVGKDVYQPPRTTMDPNAEWLTARPLKLKLMAQKAADPATEEALHALIAGKSRGENGAAAGLGFAAGNAGSDRTERGDMHKGAV